MGEPLSAVQRKQLEERLLQATDELQGRLDGLRADSQPVALDQQLQGRLSRMDALQQQAMSEAGLRQAREQLLAARRALGRLEEGEYGYCEVSGEPIGLKRLIARPVATMTVEAQEAHEQIGRAHV